MTLPKFYNTKTRGATASVAFPPKQGPKKISKKPVALSKARAPTAARKIIDPKTPLTHSIPLCLPAYDLPPVHFDALVPPSPGGFSNLDWDMLFDEIQVPNVSTTTLPPLDIPKHDQHYERTTHTVVVTPTTPASPTLAGLGGPDITQLTQDGWLNGLDGVDPVDGKSLFRLVVPASQQAPWRAETHVLRENDMQAMQVRK